jgi:hypothetical protein
MWTPEFFLARRKRQSVTVGLWVRKCSDRSSDCQLLRNDGMTWAAILHQILPKAWRYPSENHSQDSTGFRGRCHEHLTHKGVIQPLQRWPHICGQRTASRWALNKPKWQCHWSSADFGHARSSYHRPRTCNRGMGKHWIGTLSFGRGFGLEGSVRELGSCITIMHPPILCIWLRRSWPNTAFPWFIRLPTPPTWLRVIFAYSSRWKCRWKGPDLNQEKTLCGTRRLCWTPFQKMRSRSVSNTGGTAGISVCITKGTTMKEIRVNLFYINVFLRTKGSILFEHTHSDWDNDLLGCDIM